jgi:glycerol-3-phosphate dehydrogenase
VSVTGGKLTTYRRMAVDAVDEVMHLLGRSGRSRTRRLRLHGAAGYTELTDDVAPRLGLSTAQLHHLADRHGGDTRAIAALVATDQTLGAPLVDGLPHLRAEAIHAVRHELARTLDDVLARRIPARWLAARASSDAAEATARLVAPELGWDESTVEAEVAAYRAAVAGDLPMDVGA